MKLLCLKLRNFKGVRSYEFQPNGENVTVKGKNGTGKSTLFDAMLWLLFGKDSQGKKDFDIKTLDKNNNPIPGLEHEVEAVFEINGRPLKLRKNFYEVWTQKRGSVNKEFSGHTTDHFVDDVAVPQKEYLAKIDEIAKEDVFKLLTNPAHFASLDWKVRRKMLLDFCGDISNDDVMASDSKFSRLQEIIGVHKPEEHKSIAKARQTAINGTLEKIPDRIDENQRLMPETPEKSVEELNHSIELFKKALASKQQALANMENGGAVSAKQVELQTIESEIMVLEQQFKSNINSQIDKKNSSIETLRQEISTISNNINTHTQKWNQDTAKADVLEQSLVDLRVSWKDIKERVFEFEQDDVCPTCGQAIPQDKLAEAKENAQSEFNLKKSNDLEANVNNGKTAKSELDELRKTTSETNDKIAKLTADKASKEAEITKIQKEIDALRTKTIETAEYTTKSASKQLVKDEIKALQENADATESISKIKSEIEAINAAISGNQDDLKKYEDIEKQTKRIDELKQQERTLADEFAKLEGEIFLIEEFERAKISMLDDRINGRFKIARFKLFNRLINGGTEDCCEVLCDGVPYSSNLNTGHKIMVGLDIINVLSEHYGFFPPVFVDNAESVSEFPEMNCQLIQLFHVKTEKSLKVEYDTQIMKEAV